MDAPYSCTRIKNARKKIVSCKKAHWLSLHTLFCVIFHLITFSTIQTREGYRLTTRQLPPAARRQRHTRAARRRDVLRISHPPTSATGRRGQHQPHRLRRETERWQSSSIKCSLPGGVLLDDEAQSEDHAAVPDREEAREGHENGDCVVPGQTWRRG